MSNVGKSAAVLAAGVLVVVVWSVWAKPQKTSSQPAPSANDQMISNYAQEMLKHVRYWQSLWIGLRGVGLPCEVGP